MKVTAQEEYDFRCILQIAQAEPNRNLSCAEWQNQLRRFHQPEHQRRPRKLRMFGK